MFTHAFYDAARGGALVPNSQPVMVLITGNGPKLISGNTDVTTLDSILHGSVTLSDILADTGLKKSTIFSSLKRLKTYGVIDSEGEGNDRRYVMSSAPVFVSCDPDQSSMEPFFEACLFPSTSGFYRNMFYHMIAIGSANGISLKPMLINYALSLGKTAYDMMGDPIVDKGLNDLLDYLTDTGAGEFEIIDMIPLRIGMSLMKEMPYVSSVIYSEFISTIVARFVSLSTGRTYVAKTVNTEEKNGFVLEISPSKIPYPQAYGVFPLTSIRMDSNSIGPLSIYRTRQGFQAVSDKEGISVLSVITDKGLSVRDISKTLGLGEKDVSSHLSRLESLGIVTAHAGEKNMIYRSNNRPMMNWNTDSARPMMEHFIPLENAFREPDYFFYYVVSYMIIRVASIGSDITGALFSFAGHVAEHLLSIMEQPTMKKVIEAMEPCSFRKIHVESFMPFTAITEADHDLEPYIADHLSGFDVMFFGRIMESLTGHMHVVKDSRIYGEGNRYHRFTLESHD